MENVSVPNYEIAKSLNSTVAGVITADKLEGFEMAYLIAAAAGELKKQLTSQYMKPIMDLQGNKLGFKTDKDIAQGGGKGPGYPEEIVKNCLIEAVLTGVQPFGNQFNIIAGNCYITKEGFGYLLANFRGLSYKIVPELPRIKPESNSAAVVMSITWTINNDTRNEKIDFPIKVNSYMGADAVIGKATRKARAWLYNTLTGSEIADGDITDTEAKVIGSKLHTDENATVQLEDLQLLFDMKKAQLTDEEIKAAQRILTNKETNSYSKLHKTLLAK